MKDTIINAVSVILFVVFVPLLAAYVLFDILREALRKEERAI